MEPGFLRFIIPRGVDFDETITLGEIDYDDWHDGITEAELDAAWTITDLTGATAVARFKLSECDTTNIVELTSTGGGLVLGDALGTVQYLMSESETAAIGCRLEGYHELDVAFPSGLTVRYIAGEWE